MQSARHPSRSPAAPPALPERHRPRRILVTGGAGFIGSHLIRDLIRSLPEARIVNLDLLTYAGDLGRLDDLAHLLDTPRLAHVQGDICDGELVRTLLAEGEGVDTVMHLAAESHVDRSIAGPEAFVRTNITGTFTLLEACREEWVGRKDVRFHHVSTDEVRGELAPGDPPFTEASPYAPNSPYAASKAASDHLVRAYHRTYGLPVVISSCSNNFGPDQHREKFIPTVIDACLHGRPIPLYGDGTNVRDWIYVEDHCRALLDIVRGGRTGADYLVGARDERRNLEVVEAVCQIMDEVRPEGAPHRRLVRFVRDRPGHDFRYAVDPSQVERELGWRPETPFAQGLRRTVRAVLNTWDGE
ncbi:MAG: dTDP-glucose 4,6-dehydratase [Gemmatimonadales bacterium]|nr:MAG: dTDP-glucose 4,6-dehydratase [Gemmatimonadales bacterium]